MAKGASVGSACPAGTTGGRTEEDAERGADPLSLNDFLPQRVSEVLSSQQVSQSFSQFESVLSHGSHCNLQPAHTVYQPHRPPPQAAETARARSGAAAVLAL